MGLTYDQEAALETVKLGRNTFITGSGGTGKSYVVDLIRDHWAATNKAALILAPTGVAALTVRGQTIHRATKIRVTNPASLFGRNSETNKTKEYPNEAFYGWLRSNWGESARKKNVNYPTNHDAVLIDEISMVHADMFTFIDLFYRIARKCNEPMGGVQIVVVGDFFQLPPVVKSNMESKDTASLFAFETESWADCRFKVHDLKKVVRQSDEKFVKILNDIRTGNANITTMKRLKSTMASEQDTDNSIHLFCTNKSKDAFNSLKLSEIKTEIVYSNESVDTGERHILKDCLWPSTLTVKKGARVMLLQNRPDLDLCNGSIGVVEDFDADSRKIHVKFDQLDKSVAITPEVFVIETPKPKAVCQSKSKPLQDTAEIASRHQFPLTLAYAITIHKCQGLTFDKAVVHAQKTFASGQLYVAISRVRTVNGLYIVGACVLHKIDPRVAEFYNTVSLSK